MTLFADHSTLDTRHSIPMQPNPYREELISRQSPEPCTIAIFGATKGVVIHPKA